ncbi:MAG: putative sulfate exporter family transporter [Peptoniphilus sp.]|nr:putative sulfate exporter family transporter [Peptoniphilus sp.]MDY3119057.1 putative sulfate exporter family transporter [Peptoniphilus sp.]
MKSIQSFIPGVLLTLLIAAVAKFIEDLLPVPLISASVIALFIGMIINHFIQSTKSVEKGASLASKKLLKLGIILLGASLNMATVFQVGRLSISVMIFTLLTCFGLGHFSGKFFGLNWKMSNLISAGTGICGGSAIASIAPVIDADDLDIAYAMSATFIFDMVMIVAFPLLGHALGLSDMAYGLWAGTAVNDTSSVVAAGYAFSDAAGDFATMVKLTRSIVIIPTVIIFALINAHIKSKTENDHEKTGVALTTVIPWFILGFLALTFINTAGFIPESVGHSLKLLSKFLMIMALAGIGLKTSLKDMKSSGTGPMLHGFVISALVVIVAIAVEYFIGLV